MRDHLISNKFMKIHLFQYPMARPFYTGKLTSWPLYKLVQIILLIALCASIVIILQKLSVENNGTTAATVKKGRESTESLDDQINHDDGQPNQEMSTDTEMENHNHNLQDQLYNSESIWKASRQKRVRLLEGAGNFFRRNPWGTIARAVIWDFFPPSFHCPWPVERVGHPGDGGKWICGFTNHIAKKKSCIVYSYGIGEEEITFELEILQRSNCIVRMHDHTIGDNGAGPQLVKIYPNRASLFKTGLGPNNLDKLRTLKSDMELNGDEFIDILKVDVEGMEFPVLINILKEFPHELPFGQLLIEFHLESLENNIFESFYKLFERLEMAGLRPFFWEPNLFGNLFGNANYVTCSEYSFINVKILM